MDGEQTRRTSLEAGWALWNSFNDGPVSAELFASALSENPEIGHMRFDEGLTLLMRSIRCHQFGAFLALVPYSDPNAVSEGGFNALMTAAQQFTIDRKPYFERLLPISDLDTGLHEGFGHTALCLAEYGGNDDGALDLIKASVEARAVSAATAPVSAGSISSSGGGWL